MEPDIARVLCADTVNQGSLESRQLRAALSSNGGNGSVSGEDSCPPGRVLRRFQLKDDENVWVDVAGQHVFESFSRVRPKLNGAAFSEVRWEVLSGPVREDAAVLAPLSPEVVRKVRRRLRAQGVRI